jgi:hypothetical protein
MPISALVLALDPKLASITRERLSGDPRLELGSIQGARLPVVAETADLHSSRELVRELTCTPGVLAVDVVSVDFSDLGTSVAIEGSVEASDEAPPGRTGDPT